MPIKYNLDQTIEALNLLDQHDGDVYLVKKQLGIPVKTLRGWLKDQEKLRRKFDDRQYRRFANIKQELLNDMLETSRDTMKKIKSGDHPGIAVSQLAYTLTTLLSNAKKLEDNYVRLAPNPQNEQPNRLRFVYDDYLPAAPPRTERNPQTSRPLQSVGLREALGQIGVGNNRHPESSPHGTQTLLVGRPHLQNGGANLARSEKKRQTPRRRRNKRQRTPH